METFGFRTMDMAYTTLSAAEKKKFARLFVTRNHIQNLQHLLPEFQCQIHDGLLTGKTGGTMCEMCSRSGKTTCDLDLDERPFLSIGGLPCQPFSRMRFSGTGKGNEGASKDHSKYKVVFEMFSSYIARRRPYGVVVEEVEEFARAERGAGPSDPTPLERLLGVLSVNGYFSQALFLDSAVWIAQSRPRLYVVACSPEIGGAAAVGWIGSQVSQLFQHRTINPPAQIWDVLLKDADHTDRRIRVAEEASRGREGSLRVAPAQNNIQTTSKPTSKPTSISHLPTFCKRHRFDIQITSPSDLQALNIVLTSF